MFYTATVVFRDLIFHFPLQNARIADLISPSHSRIARSAAGVVGQNFVPEVFLGRANIPGQIAAFFSGRGAREDVHGGR